MGWFLFTLFWWGKVILFCILWILLWGSHYMHLERGLVHTDRQSDGYMVHIWYKTAWTPSNTNMPEYNYQKEPCFSSLLHTILTWQGPKLFSLRICLHHWNILYCHYFRDSCRHVTAISSNMSVIWREHCNLNWKFCAGYHFQLDSTHRFYFDLTHCFRFGSTPGAIIYPLF